MSDEEDDYQAGRIETQAQFNDYERVGIPGFIDIDQYIDSIGKRNKLFMSDIEKFVKSVFFISNELKDEGLLKSEDVREILDNISKLNKPGYKNATAYVIGYLVSNRGKNFTPKNLEKYLNMCIINSYRESEGLDCSVIIRYGRLWTTINNNI
jgi:hypothetical protein